MLVNIILIAVNTIILSDWWWCQTDINSYFFWKKRKQLNLGDALTNFEKVVAELTQLLFQGLETFYSF